MPREELRKLQLERLQQMLKRIYENVPFYQKSLDDLGFHWRDLTSLEQLRHLPFTTKDALRDNYPFGLLAVPKRRLVRLHASSGTTGKPTVVGYTREDLEMWAGLVARIVVQAGVTADDTAQICFGYGLFTGGFGLHYGLEKVGVTVVPASSGNTEKQLMLMRDFESTVLVSTPTYAMYMAEVARENGIDPAQLPVRIGMFGGEPWSESLRRELEEQWGLKATDNYGLSEVVGPGVAGECQARCGMHIAEDHFIVEVINPDSGEPLEDGDLGELVFTALTKEALPLLRYRTGDIARVWYDPCPCGRTHARMEKVSGRTDDMLIIRGVNIFPSQVESVLMEIDGVGPQFQIVVDKEGYMDRLEVEVELTPERFTGNWRELEGLREDVEEKLRNTLGVSAKVRLLEYGSLERTTGKAKRVVDRREGSES